MSDHDLDRLTSQIEQLDLEEQMLLMEHMVALLKRHFFPSEKQTESEEGPLETVIEMLEGVSEKPRLWMGAEGSSVDNFLQGVRAVCRWLDLYDDDEFLKARIKALAGRGIAATTLSPYSKIKKRLGDPQIAASEMLLIEADTLQIIVNNRLQETE